MSDWIKTIAPLLGTALGGPLGGAAAAFIASKLGLESDTVEAVTDVLQSGRMTPDQIAQVKLAEIDFQKFLKENEIRLGEIEAKDRDSARVRDTAYVQAGRWNFRADLLAVLAVGGLIFCMWLVARDADLPERAVNAIMFVAGVLAAAMRDVYSFEFGSSRGSKEKDKQLQSLLK
jgi:hypothetical protein